MVKRGNGLETVLERRQASEAGMPKIQRKIQKKIKKTKVRKRDQKIELYGWTVEVEE